MTPTQALAQHIAETPRAWPDAVVQRARLAFIDTIGCMLAGHSSPQTGQASRTARFTAPGRIMMPGANLPLSPSGAALVGGTAAHSLEHDDVFEPLRSHPSAVLVPAILAARLLANSDGADLLDAYVIGLDAQAVIAGISGEEHYKRGWHSTSTAGSIAAAAAVARLLRLTSDQATSALALALGMAAGSRRETGWPAEALLAGMAAQNGVMAALLARSGARARPGALEGVWGFTGIYNGSCPAETALPPLAQLTPSIDNPGLWSKPYPCSIATHRAIDAILDLKRQGNLPPDGIDRIEVTVSDVEAQSLTGDDTTTGPATARFDMSHCVAVAVLHEPTEEAPFSDPQIINSTRMQHLRSKVSVHSHSHGSTGPEQDWAEVRIRPKQGNALSKRITYSLGHPQNPMDEDAIRRKYARGSANVLSLGQIERTLDVLLHLGETPVDPLFFDQFAAPSH
ncbi:MmgE/PrpD family protein [Pelagibius sp. CAU 1746]|uniref:MmgE/PrpD family protein n=1 Tax=Pelagibius sp. CAU 1746 TaxID=3140370 RepID=UPI00325C295D